MLTKDTQDWVARARALAPMIEAAADRTEKERKIPADVLAAMHACGLFHMLLPVSLGGGAVDLVTFNRGIAISARIFSFTTPGCHARKCRRDGHFSLHLVSFHFIVYFASALTGGHLTFREGGQPCEPN